MELGIEGPNEVGLNKFITKVHLLGEGYPYPGSISPFVHFSDFEFSRGLRGRNVSMVFYDVAWVFVCTLINLLNPCLFMFNFGFSLVRPRARSSFMKLV